MTVGYMTVGCNFCKGFGYVRVRGETKPNAVLGINIVDLLTYQCPACDGEKIDFRYSSKEAIKHGWILLSSND